MSKAIKMAIINAAEFYGRQLSENVLAMYAEDLEDLNPEAVCEAYKNYRRNPANRIFPLPAQIRELVAPEEYVAVETQAREIASRIVGGIARYGWCNGKEAELAIGPEGWALVRRYGGWARLCEDVGTGYGKLNPLTLQAQMRDQLEGTIRYGRDAVEQAIGVGQREPAKELKGPSHSEMIRALISRLPPKPPEEPA